MKSFKDIEKTRRDYHQDAALNSVHSASLTVPEMPGTRAEVSFSNHFLLKRGYDHVACRVTAVDAAGGRIEFWLHPVTEPRVYTLPLSGMTDAPASTYLVEFFAAENLFIPFPAVMVNHTSEHMINTVHAYNRVLNDVFEDDSINARPVREASICMARTAGADTFAVFSAGQMRCAGTVELEVAYPGSVLRGEIEVDLPRFGHQTICLRDHLPDLPEGVPGVLKIRQPKQPLFYGRLLTGQRDADGLFTANHSYYDSSETAEYWEGTKPSERLYPFFAEVQNLIRMYPIMSPGTLAVSVILFDAGGRELRDIPVGEVESPGARFLDVSVNRLIAEASLAPNDVSAFAVRAAGDRVPTRVNHQIVHASGGLEASVNISLNTPNTFEPKGKPGLTWGQVPLDDEIESWLGIVGGLTGRDDADIEVTFYDGGGELARRVWRLPGNGAISLRPAVELATELETRHGIDNRYVWYMIKSSRPDLSAFAVTRHRGTGHCTGEHSY